MNYIQQDTYDEVCELCNAAITVSSKKEAQKFIDRLNFIHCCGGYTGYTNILLSELVAGVKSASGRVADKERLCSFVQQGLYKLESQIKKEGGGC